MKITLLFFATLLMSFSCKEDQIGIVEKVEFTTMGMSGVFEHITITPDSVFVETGQRRTDEPPKSVSKSIRRDAWKTVLNALSSVSTTGIDSLKSPTNKRAFDGAMHSEITITTVDEEIFRHSFDDETPHQKLQPLMEVIRKLSGKSK